MNNDLEQFSEERLMELIHESSKPEIEALARIALAVKQARPVAQVYQPANIGICAALGPEIGMINVGLAAGTLLYTTPQPAHTEQDGWVSIPKDMLADYRDVKNGEVQAYKASFGSYCDIPGSRWQKELADLTEELAEIDKLIAAAPKPNVNLTGEGDKSDGWIKCSERMPQNNEQVLTWNGQYKATDLFLAGGFMCNKPKIITHWMPLPAAPKPESE